MGETEGDIQKQIKKYLEDKGYIVFRMNSGYVRKNVKLSPPGTPDLLVLMDYGETMWIEVKVPFKLPTKIQQAFHRKIRNLQHNVILAHSVDDVKNL